MVFGIGRRFSAEDSALVDMLGLLKRAGYRFVTVTPATHARVVARPDRAQAKTLADALGWSLKFPRHVVPDDVRNCLRRADMLDRDGALWSCRLRVSSLHDELFIHSAYPTLDHDAVFFGPDSYRFSNAVAAELQREPPPALARIVDIGAGAGVGGIVAAKLCPQAEIVMTDINPRALHYARINAVAAGVEPHLVETSGLDGVDGRFDIAMINPPYIADESGRRYRDGGADHGGRLALELAAEAIDRLTPGGRLILYTGSAIIAGEDRLELALGRLAAAHDAAIAYHEIDPDVFGEELERPAYQEVDRIALVLAIITAAS